MIKKIICFLTHSHKHLKVDKELSSDTNLVTCVRCENQFIYHERIDVYKKRTKELEEMHLGYGQMENIIGGILGKKVEL